MKTFYLAITNTLIASVTTFFVWFALTFWLYLETQSVISTSIIGGLFMIAMALSGFWLGSIVDHNKKKTAMMISSLATLFFFLIAFLVYTIAPEEAFKSISSPWLWILITPILFAVTAGNIRGIAIPTLVTMLVPEDRRDKANGFTGMVMGASSFGAGITSGIALANIGLLWVLVIGIFVTFITIIHLLTIKIPEDKIAAGESQPTDSISKTNKIDIRGTISAIKSVPGLLALILFTMFNNFLGGIFAALLDAYGLSLVSVEAWGTIWGILSLGFILGGLYIAKKGLGKNPVTTLFRINIITWLSCIFFAIQPSIILLCGGIFIWVVLSPFIEATEHTIVQKVVPLERQGRVFGFAQSVELSASPLASFLIGPITQFIFIPYMTTGAGVELIGNWFGMGPGRGIAIVFTLAGILGLMITLIAMRSRPYKLLSEKYNQQP